MSLYDVLHSKNETVYYKQ